MKYEWSASHIDGIKFFKVTKKDVERYIDTFDSEIRHSQSTIGFDLIIPLYQKMVH